MPSKLWILSIYRVNDGIWAPVNASFEVGGAVNRNLKQWYWLEGNEIGLLVITLMNRFPILSILFAETRWILSFRLTCSNSPPSFLLPGKKIDQFFVPRKMCKSLMNFMLLGFFCDYYRRIWLLKSAECNWRCFRNCDKTDAHVK